jgi:hypothetical protein
MMRLDDPHLPSVAEEAAFFARLSNLERLIGELRGISDEQPDGQERWEATLPEIQRALVLTYGDVKKLQRVQ